MSDIADNRRKNWSAPSRRYGERPVRRRVLLRLGADPPARETIEQMAHGYRRLETVAGATGEQLYQQGAEARRLADSAARKVGDPFEGMDRIAEVEE